MKHLNEEQQIAVKHIEGPMLVLAGPGSGKTTVICHRVKNLLENKIVSDKRILVITFSKAATLEMKNRFLNLTNNEYPAVCFSTFHAFFYRILRRFTNISDYTIIYEDEKKQIILNVLSNLKILIDDAEEVDDIINEIAIVKNELISLNDFDSNTLSKEDFTKVFSAYEQEKIDAKKIDFDDMLSKCYNLLMENKEALEISKSAYKYVLIDEFQDINKVQYECIKLLSSDHKNLFAVGDDDQSIYRFRGSNPKFLLNFKNDFDGAKEILLKVNYRSTDSIIKLSSVIINENKKRFTKHIKGIKVNKLNPKYVHVEDIKKEASFIADKIESLNVEDKIDYDEIAVIFRTNLQSRAIIEAFMDRNIPFILRDFTNSIYDHYTVKDILSYLKLCININDNESLLRIFNKPNRYISRALTQSFTENLKDEESLIKKMSYSNKLEEWQQKNISTLYLFLKELKKKKPYEAISYIRKTIDYNKYLEDICDKRKVNMKGLVEILDELRDVAEPFETIEEFLEHIELLKQKTKENIEMVKDSNRKCVVLSTMHSSKGLEFEAVFVCGLVEGVVPHELSKTNDEIEEERRLFYVAVTRAKSYLFLSSYKIRYEKDVKRTRFLHFLK